MTCLKVSTCKKPLYCLAKRNLRNNSTTMGINFPHVNGSTNETDVNKTSREVNDCEFHKLVWWRCFGKMEGCNDFNYVDFNSFEIYNLQVIMPLIQCVVERRMHKIVNGLMFWPLQSRSGRLQRRMIDIWSYIYCLNHKSWS